MNKKFNFAVISILSTLICIGIIVFGLTYTKNGSKKKNTENKETDSFNIKLIKALNVKKNYLVSPYSIEIALNMLNEGANGNTKEQIDSLLPDRKINDVSIKNRVNVANAVFIKDKYKKIVKDSFKNKLVKDYNSDVLYDIFNTPTVINNWVNEQTDGMIKKVVDELSDDFVLGLANAVAIDVDWLYAFDCSDTKGEEFTKADGKKINVEMMHDSYKKEDIKYLESDDAKGIILPYKSYNTKTGDIADDGEPSLEFIGILPNKDVNTYINSLTDKDLDKLISSAKSASSKYEIRLSLPRFNYEYDVNKFGDKLSDLGIKDAFDPDKANFSKIADKKDLDGNLYVSTAVHKTYIDLNEKGTKAAAVTFFGLDSFMAAPDNDKEVVEVKFNKPFIYMIRDTKSKEVLFFGAVYEPNIWTGTTCSMGN